MPYSISHHDGKYFIRHKGSKKVVATTDSEKNLRGTLWHREHGEGRGAGKNNPADTAYKILSFQYRPVEKHIKSHVLPEQWKQYQKLPSHRKIYFLDKWKAKYLEGEGPGEGRGGYSPDYYAKDKWMGRGGGDYPNDPPGYHTYVMRMEKQGLTTSDAQGAADAHFAKKRKSGKSPLQEGLDKLRAEKGRGGTPPAGHHSASYWQKWAKQEHKSDTAAKNEYSQGENAIERKIPSESTPGKEYRVWGDKGNMHCSCPSFTYRNTCKHVQSLGEEGPKRKLKYGRNYYYKNE